MLPQLHLLRFEVGQAYLWQDPDGLTLVDTGPPGSAAAIAGAIRDLGRRTDEVRQVVLTHFHGDHVGSAAEVAGWGEVTIAAHRLDAPFVRGEAAGPPPVLTDFDRPLYERIVRGRDDLVAAPAPVDRELDDGDAPEFGGGARVLAIPGHTPGSIAVHLPGPRVLFTGDTVASTAGRPILGVFNVDRAATMESFRRLAGLDVDVACFGHGDAIVGDAAAALRAAAAALTT